jgi:hypothetical protein
MPVQLTNPSTRQRLTNQLVERFRGNIESPVLPLVVENRVRPVHTIHLLVIWDEWQEMPNPERSRIIADAFALANPDEVARVTIPMGLTASEALSLGYLPYRIVPSVRKSDGLSATAIDKAMRAVGGIFIQIGSDRQLRFATRSQAELAYRDLATKLPAPIWTLIQEQSPAESA